jgi:hypothetical protein
MDIRTRQNGAEQRLEIIAKRAGQDQGRRLSTHQCWNMKAGRRSRLPQFLEAIPVSRCKCQSETVANVSLNTRMNLSGQGLQLQKSWMHRSVPYLWRFEVAEGSGGSLQPDRTEEAIEPLENRSGAAQRAAEHLKQLIQKVIWINSAFLEEAKKET